ncbi:MAG: hypothetical protein ACI9J5_003206, partial [Paraglaciecola sp.]
NLACGFIEDGKFIGRRLLFSILSISRHSDVSILRFFYARYTRLTE